MKRKISDLSTFGDLDRKLMKDRVFVEKLEREEYKYKLLESLIDLRLKKGLSQAELAERIDSKQPVISRLERGIVKPSVSLLKRVARALDAKLIVKFAEI